MSQHPFARIGAPQTKYASIIILVTLFVLISGCGLVDRFRGDGEEPGQVGDQSGEVSANLGNQDGSTQEKIVFPEGSTSGSISKTLTEGEADEFVLAASAGQALTYQADSSDNSLRISVFDPGVDDPISTGIVGESVAISPLTRTGDYIFRVESTDGQAAQYSLIISLEMPVIEDGTAPPAENATRELLIFPAGATSARVESSVEAGMLKEYLFEASAGQTAGIEISPLGENPVAFTLSNADRSVVFAPEAEGSTTLTQSLPDDGQYLIEVRSDGEGETGYALVVNLEPAAAATGEEPGDGTEQENPVREPEGGEPNQPQTGTAPAGNPTYTLNTAPLGLLTYIFKGNREGTGYRVWEIEIKQKQGNALNTIQNIPVKSLGPIDFNNNNVFIIQDLNGDGFSDLRLLSHVPAGANLPYLYWLYNSTSNQFEPNQALEALTSPEYLGNGIIRSFERSNAATATYTYYRWQNGQLVLDNREVCEVVNNGQNAQYTRTQRQAGTETDTVIFEQQYAGVECPPFGRFGK